MKIFLIKLLKNSIQNMSINQFQTDQNSQKKESF